MRLTTLLSICSAITLGACTSVQRPNSYAWGVNGAASRLEGYNVRTDYNSDGTRKSGAVKQIKSLPNGLKDLNGAICFLPPKPNDQLGDEGIKGMKIWLGDLRDWAKEHCQ